MGVIAGRPRRPRAKTQGDGLRRSPAANLKDGTMPETPMPGVLVVDSEPLIRRMVTSLLSERGYRICEATNGAEALHCLATNPEVAVMITDIDLADVSGWSLATQAIAARPDLRLVYTSAAGNSAAMDQSPPGRFLAKPYSLARLVIAVADALAD